MSSAGKPTHDSSEQITAAFRGCIEVLDGEFPLSQEQCFRVLSRAQEESSLDSRTVLARLLWLIDPREPETEGIHLLRHSPSMAEEDIVRALVSPSGPVLEVIRRTTGLDPAFLRSVYERMRNRGQEECWQISELSDERILQEMKWWLTSLQFPEYYLKHTPPDLMARQIMLNRSYELQGPDSEAYARMKISSTSAEDGTSMHWVHEARSIEIEEEIEKEYYSGASSFNVAVYSPYRSLFLYIVYRSAPSRSGDDFNLAAPGSFLSLTEKAAQGRYQEVWRSVMETGNVAISHSRREDTGENRVMIGFPRGTIQHFLANLSRVMSRNGIAPTRKYTVTFGGSRPVIVASVYARETFPPDLLKQLVEVSLYPPGAAASSVEKSLITPQEANFLHATNLFVHQFISVRSPDIDLLNERFRDDKELSEILTSLKARMDRDSYPLGLVEQTLLDRLDIVHDLFAIFKARFDPAARESSEASARRRLEEAFSSSVLGPEEAEIVRCAIRFADGIERTNFFAEKKSALCFRLARGSIARTEQTLRDPYGIFFVAGRDFHGFHIRFKDIARGGIRIVRSASHDEQLRNSDMLFEECFNLAWTQDKKNKDIPEGGAKGVILPAAHASRAEEERAFHQYVDSLLDLLTGEPEEILFLGPDEGTADLMDWASGRARERGYRYWKAFTTGKSAELGGISHKEHGMTTHGVHQYVLGILRKLGIAEAAITKAQTGGPDGDLGANEILVSRDRTTALIDGGGVLFDPDGLDRDELRRLASVGSDSSGFDEAKLGPRGFKIGVTEKDRTLPDGAVVTSGLGFRNAFHLDRRIRADLFVPCGGRPKSINLANWRSLLDGEGVPLFKWIVEGANLFITQEARLKLEAKGVILFKDSSTNKGGVISSSLEVLAALCLTDEEYARSMSKGPDGSVPIFRARYISEAVQAIKKRADMEFEVLWRARGSSGKWISELSEAVSERINSITTAIEESTLFDDIAVRRAAVSRHVPAILVETVGLDALMERLPSSYLRALVASSIASSFVYEKGMDAGFEDYRVFVRELAERGK